MAGQREPQDKSVQVNGLNLHYLDWGGPSDRVLLFVHGVNGTSHAFDHVAAELADEFRVLAIDQRGHGDSDWTREGYAVRRFASDLYEFAEAVKIAPYDLVGWSLGTRNGIPYAGDHSAAHLKHFIMVDYGPEMSVASARNLVANTVNPPRGFRTRDDIYAYLRESFPRAVEVALRNVAEHNYRLNYAGRYVPKPDPEIFWINGSFGVAEVPYLWEQFGKIVCPLLEMKGALSDYLSPEILERMQQAQPSLEIIEIPEATHFIPYDNPTAFAQGIRRFLGTVAE